MIGIVIVVAIVLAGQPQSVGCGSSSSASPALDYTFYLQIEIWGKLSNGTITTQYVFPPANVGLAGGPCSSTQYHDYGLNGRYPIYTLPTDYESQLYPGFTLIHVTSSVTRTYLLSDFFEVWGEPLAQNNTLGLTAPPPAGQSSRFPSDWSWWFFLTCTPTPQYGNWTWQPLSSGMTFLLYYGNTTTISNVC